MADVRCCNIAITPVIRLLVNRQFTRHFSQRDCEHNRLITATITYNRFDTATFASLFAVPCRLYANLFMDSLAP